MANPRVIITAKYLVESFGAKINDVDMLISVLAPFASRYDDALQYFDDRIVELDDVPDDDPGKQGAIEVWEHLKSAYTKMSNVERERVAKEIVDELANLISERYKAK